VLLVELEDRCVVRGVWVGRCYGSRLLLHGVRVYRSVMMESARLMAIPMVTHNAWPASTHTQTSACVHACVRACVATPAVAVGNRNIAHATLTRLIFTRQFCCFVLVVRGGEICSCLVVYLPWAVTSSAAEVVTFSKVKSKKRSYPRSRPWRPTGLRDVEDPTLSRQSAHRWNLGCQFYAPAALCSPEGLFSCFWHSFLLEAE
jgi:hypothetical protein